MPDPKNTPDASEATPPAETPSEALDEASLDAPLPAPRWYRNKQYAAVLIISVPILLLLGSAGLFDSLAQTIIGRLTPPAPAHEVTEEAPMRPVAEPFTFRSLDLHPDLLYQTYLASPMLSPDANTPAVQVVNEFRELLDLYYKRAGVDDNFTLRVLDNRTYEVLEVYEMKAERATYEETKLGDWGTTDAKRRDLTRRLVQKYIKRGIPKDAISVKWGRANQIREAREREQPFIEYEVRLARTLGLSLLSTEIGTVETFNQDRLVSSVGARSRYQMMPYVLRDNGIRRYNLRTGAGHAVSVLEEHHPLLTMESAFLTLRGYVNAVGHEIPGISSYHTGPGNLYKVFRLFLLNDEPLYSADATVMDAYMWAVTDGFETVSEKSTFRDFSRAYVPSAYGALRALEDVPVDTSLTLRAELVQVKQDNHLFLSNLLRSLGEAGKRLDWGTNDPDLSLYERFRAMNEHIQLPEPDQGNQSVPVRGDVRLVAEAEGAPVRFFLPLGATRLLQQAGVDVLDETATQRFDSHAFGPPARREITVWDRQYDALVRDIGRFGFTTDNLKRLRSLRNRFDDLAEANPTPYRLAQRKIIRTHALFWGSKPWRDLAEAVAAASGTLRPPIRPLERLQPPRVPPTLRSMSR